MWMSSVDKDWSNTIRSALHRLLPWPQTKFHQDIYDISVPSQINEPLSGSKLIAGPSQVNSFDWQERDEAVTLIGSGMTNSHYESVVIQRGSLASGESVFFCQHMHARRQAWTRLFLFLLSTISRDTASHPSRTERVKSKSSSWIQLAVPCTEALVITPVTAKNISLELLYSFYCILETQTSVTMSTSAVRPDTLTHILKKKPWCSSKLEIWEGERLSDSVGAEEEILDMGKLWNEKWEWEISSGVF